MIKVCIWPTFALKDNGDGGIRRIVEAQRRYLPDHDIQVVETPEEADVVTAHVSAPDAWFSTHAAKPLVAMVHGLYWSEYDWHGRWHEMANRDVLRLVKAADITTVPSSWVRDVILRHACRDARVIPHGINLDEWTPGRNAGYVLWNKTRPDAVCDPRPVRELARLLPDCQFMTTFWDSDQEPNEPVQKNVRVIGREPYADAKERVRRAGVYLATSLETFGIGTLEALAAGVPVVGFDYGGQRDIIEHLKDGYLARPGDYNDLARGVIWARKYRSKIAPWAKEKAEAFQWRDAMVHYAEVYREAMLLHKGAPRVSVVVTAYGVEKYIAGCLRSVLTQSMADLEVIVVDDCSPDNSGAIARDVGADDPRVFVLQTPHNLNVADARNFGIRHARGRYVFILDGDDRLEPRALETLADALDHNRDISVAYGGLYFEREADGKGGNSGWPVPFDFADFCSKGGQPMPYASMFRREAWAQTGGFRRRVRSSEDCDFYLRLASYGWTPAKVTNADTVRYLIREGSRSDTEGHADAENKRWFPWTYRPELAPAGAGGSQVALNTPVVSVIIPVGPGHEDLVKDAVDSVEAQTFRAFEVIVVNDTGDDTGGTLPELPAWVHLLNVRRGDVALGPASARNIGIGAAKAPYYLALDADDYLEPQALEAMLDAQRIAGGEEIIYSDFWSVYESGAMVREDLADWDCERLLEKAIHGVTALTPRAVWQRVDGYEAGVPWEDWDFALKAAAAGVCSRRIAAPLWCYRKDTGTIRQRAYDDRESLKRVIFDRWREYIEGDKKLAGCATCGSNRTLIPAPRNVGSMAGISTNLDETVKVEYIGPNEGKQPIRGRYTGTNYTFQREHAKHVHPEDAKGFINDWPTLFRLVPNVTGTVHVDAGATPVLTAPGPRAHVAEPSPAPASQSAIESTEDVGRPLSAGATVPDIADLPPPPGRKD